MEIHKPKAAHSWREFLIEIGTIICGILIALGLEQAVEAAHRQEQVSKARENLRREVGSDLSIVLLQQREQPCVDAYLDRYEAWATGGPKPVFQHIPNYGLQDSVWDLLKAGAVASMGLDEQLGFAKVYSGIENQRGFIERARENVANLESYAGKRDVARDDAGELLRLIQHARNDARSQAVNSPALVEDASSLGIKPADLPPALPHYVDQLCHLAGK